MKHRVWQTVVCFRPATHSIEREFVQEILTVATYLVAWLVCRWVLQIESGLVTLIVSLGASLFVYILIGVKELEEKRKKKNRD
jgi:hypothetical protein